METARLLLIKVTIRLGRVNALAWSRVRQTSMRLPTGCVSRIVARSSWNQDEDDDRKDRERKV